MEEIRLEDYHHLAIENQPPEFTDHQTKLDPLDSFEPWSRIWQFSEWWGPYESSMQIGTRFTVPEFDRTKWICDRACARLGVYAHNYERLEADAKKTTRWDHNRQQYIKIPKEQQESKRVQLVAVQAAEKKLTNEYSDQFPLFEFSIAHGWHPIDMHVYYNTISATDINRGTTTEREAMNWPISMNTTTAAVESSSCEPDPLMKEFRVRYMDTCPEKQLPYVLREYFHSSPMSAMGLQPYFTIPTINVIFDYLWTGPAVFGSRGFKFMQHWDGEGGKLPFQVCFPYELKRDKYSDGGIKLPIYHSLEMIGHLHTDQPIEGNPKKLISLDRTDDDSPTLCSWSHFMHKSMEEIRLEDYHQMNIQDQPPPEFTDQQALNPIESFESTWSRSWYFDDYTTHKAYMNIKDTRVSMKVLSKSYLVKMYHQLACQLHHEDNFKKLESELMTRESRREDQSRYFDLNAEKVKTIRGRLEAIRTTEKVLNMTHAETFMLFQLSIIHALGSWYLHYRYRRRHICRPLGRRRHQYHPNLEGDVNYRFAYKHMESVLQPCFETKYHAFSDNTITYSLRMNIIATGDYSSRNLYLGWSSRHIDQTHLFDEDLIMRVSSLPCSSLPVWEEEFLELPAMEPDASAVIKVEIHCQRHSPDRVTQTMIITRLHHPSTEIYRSTLPDIVIEHNHTGDTDMSGVYRYSDIPNPLVTCQLREIDSSCNSVPSFSLTSEAGTAATSSIVRQFIVTWLVDGIEVNQQPLLVDCDTLESKSAFIDEVCQPILYTSLGVKYELCQQLGPNPYWRPGYFPTDFDQAKLVLDSIEASRSRILEDDPLESSDEELEEDGFAKIKYVPMDLV